MNSTMSTDGNEGQGKIVEKAAAVKRDLNKVGQIPELIFRVLIMFNLLIILYVTSLTGHALWGYVHEGSALEFLVRTGHVPMENWIYPVTGLMLYACLVLLLTVECNNHPELVCKLILEFGVAIGISYATEFGYVGMIALLLADIMRYTIDWQKRAMYIVAVSVFFLFMNSNILQGWLGVAPLETVWNYYRADHKSMMLGILNMLGLINMVIFFFYMVILALAQMSEKEQIMVLNNELKQANSKLEEYASESARMAETRERNRLAREIHDTLGHSLTGIITGIEACIMLMDIAPDATKEQLRAIAEVARTGIIDVRHSVKALHPDALESMDLENALRKLIDSTTRSTGVEITYRFDADLNHFNQDEEDVVYRVVQESITNAIRHGKASRIQIEITRKDADLHIVIRDNGKGCSEIKPGFGLHHMKERVEMLGGDLEYRSGDGFEVHAVIPIRWGTEAR